ncbi:MAG: exopolysaccharide biosynthesis protein [Pirellulaceae bacterium]|nr:MAG: exopolysaccharide biosynthesis protein [Pirellulaceae bacterium]
MEFVDIHSHFLPEIDDGARSWEESLEMARIAVADGIRRIIVTPHQLGVYQDNSAQTIIDKTRQFQRLLHEHAIGLEVLPGADVRVEADLVERIKSGDVLTLGGHGKHVLLELPHEMYVPIEGLVASLLQIGVVPILSHPERNEGIIDQPKLLEPLLRLGCLMQVTAGSLLGAFGPDAERTSRWLASRRWIHFLATDAHRADSRRPLMRRAWQRLTELTDQVYANQVCSTNPLAVFLGRPVPMRAARSGGRRGRWWNWWRRAA